jgi:hypothetical protein
VKRDLSFVLLQDAINVTVNIIVVLIAGTLLTVFRILFGLL